MLSYLDNELKTYTRLLVINKRVNPLLNYLIENSLLVIVNNLAILSLSILVHSKQALYTLNLSMFYNKYFALLFLSY